MAAQKNSLSYEIWEPVIEGDDVNTIFNSFLNTNLRIFYSSFPLIEINKVIQIQIFIKREFTIQVFKIFNSLPFNIKKFSDNPRTFKSTLKHFFYMKSFYSSDE